MATQLHKPIYRETEINGKAFIVGLDPTHGLTYREKGKRSQPGTLPLASLLNEPEKVAAAAPAALNNINYHDLRGRIEALPQSKQLLDIVNEIYGVNLLASDLSDEEIAALGVNPPEAAES